MTKLENGLTKDLPRFFLQGGVNHNYRICDREEKGRTIVRIVHHQGIVKPILELLNKEFGYLD